MTEIRERFRVPELAVKTREAWERNPYCPQCCTKIEKLSEAAYLAVEDRAIHRSPCMVEFLVNKYRFSTPRILDAHSRGEHDRTD